MAKLQQGYLFDGRYQLKEKLGEGGCAEVWLVVDNKTQLTMALKIFLPEAQLDVTSVKLFQEEFTLAYNINHPNLLKYSFFDICMGYPYIVMPYYSQGSAESILGRCGETRAWKYLHDVAAGLSCLHGHYPAIIHQDIKPSNVLLDDTGYIITDFGISANVQNLSVNSNSGNCSVKGTRAYMPPEKFLDNPLLSVKNDIWSLGASLYELLTGQLPFGGKGGECQLLGMSIPHLPSAFSYDLQYVVRECMSPDPNSRPTAKELEQYASEKLNPKPYTNNAVNSNSYSKSGGYSYSGQSVSPVNYFSSHSSLEKPVKFKKERNLFPLIVTLVSVVGIAVMVFVFTLFMPDKEGRIVQENNTEQVEETNKDVKKNTEEKTEKKGPKTRVETEPSIFSPDDPQEENKKNEEVDNQEFVNQHVQCATHR